MVLEDMGNISEIFKLESSLKLMFRIAHQNRKKKCRKYLIKMYEHKNDIKLKEEYYTIVFIRRF